MNQADTIPNLKNRSWSLWTAAVLLLLPVLYAASFGPACWIYGLKRGRDVPLLPRVYTPIGEAIRQSPVAFDTLLWYAKLGMNRDIAVPTLSGDAIVILYWRG